MSMLRSMSLKKHNQSGYTLIELMIVLIMLGVVTSIAVPHYASFVRDARRADAVSDTTRILSQQELFYGNNGNRYAANVAQLGLPVYGGNNDTTITSDGNYSITMRNCAGNAIAATDSCIMLTAEALAGTSQRKDINCRKLIVNSHGGQRSEDSSGSVSTDGSCWN